MHALHAWKIRPWFIVTHPFSQLTKTSERVNAAGDRCVAITLMQYFIAIEH